MIKFKADGLSASQVILLMVAVVSLTTAIGLVVTWCLLHFWNSFAVAAGLNATVPINWSTVVGLWIIIWVARSIFSRGKD